MPQLTTDNTNALAHRVAGDSLVYDCPACEYGEVLVTALIEDEDARCLDCGTRYRLVVERVDQDPTEDEAVASGAAADPETDEDAEASPDAEAGPGA
jgi:DNA-directed RNA polymerase subunit RPC12/RpoP